MSSHDLDEAIDEAVRGVMSAEPNEGLRARVMRGIEAPEPHRVKWPRFAVAAGLASVAALVVLQVSRGPEAPGTTQPTAAAPAAAVAQAPRAVPPVRTADATPHNRTPRSGRPLHAAGRHAAPDESRMVLAASVIDANAEMTDLSLLETVQPITIAPLRRDALQLSEIVIAPLHFEPVRVDPLSSPPR